MKASVLITVGLAVGTGALALAAAMRATPTATPEPTVATPPPLLMINDDELNTLGIRLEVEATLLDVNGDYWQQPVRLSLANAAKDWRSGVEVFPDASGNVLAYTYIPYDEVNPNGSTSGKHAGYELTFWAHPTLKAERGAEGPFLSEIEGIASKHLVFPKGDLGSGFEVELKKIYLTEPPYVGTLDFVAPTTAGLFLSVDGAQKERFTEVGGISFPWRYEVPIGTTSIPLYSWGSDGACDYLLRNDFGFYMAAGTVSRGAHATVEVPTQTLVYINVDKSTYPSARAVCVVAPADHQPNPQAPGGSDIDYATTSQELSQASAKFGEAENGVFYESVVGFGLEGYILQIWGWDPAVSGSTPSLLDSQPLPSSPGTHTLTF